MVYIKDCREYAKQFDITILRIINRPKRYTLYKKGKVLISNLTSDECYTYVKGYSQALNDKT